MCTWLGLSPQAYYAWERRQRLGTARARLALAAARALRQLMPRLGTRKLHVHLKRLWPPGHPPLKGRDWLHKLLTAAGALVPPKSAYPKRTHQASAARYPDRYNALKDTGLPPERCLVADITTLHIGYRHQRYLALVTDAASRYVLGWSLGVCQDTALVEDALRRALEQRHYPPGPMVHHSDHGTQYTSERFAAFLKANALQGSMAPKGNAQANGRAERLNGILKHELGLGKRFQSAEALHQAVPRAIDIYNHYRPHNACNGRTPYQQHIHAKPQNIPLLV